MSPEGGIGSWKVLALKSNEVILRKHSTELPLFSVGCTDMEFSWYSDNW